MGLSHTADENINQYNSTSNVRVCLPYYPAAPVLLLGNCVHGQETCSRMVIATLYKITKVGNTHGIHEQ